MRRALRLYAEARTYTALVWLLLGLPLGILWFTVVVTGLALGVGLAITVLGLPVLVLTLLLVRGIASVERALAESLAAAPMPRRPPEPEARGVLWSRLRALVARRRTWRELAYVLLRLPLGALDFSVAVGVVALALGGFAEPVLVAAGADNDIGSWHVDTVPEALLFVPVSLAFLLVAAGVIRGWTRISAGVATALLGKVEQPQVKREVGRLLARGEADAFQLMDGLELRFGRGPFLRPVQLQAALLALRDTGLVVARRDGGRDVWALTR